MVLYYNNIHIIVIGGIVRTSSRLHTFPNYVINAAYSTIKLISCYGTYGITILIKSAKLEVGNFQKLGHNCVLKNMSENRQRMREAEKKNKAKVTPGMTLASLTRFRAASIGPTQARTPEEESTGMPENPDSNNSVFCCSIICCCCRCYCLCVNVRHSCDPGGASDGWARG